MERRPSDPPDIVRRFVAWTVRHGRALWIIALLLAIPAAVRTAGLYMHIKTGMDELLPRDAPSVRALDEVRSRLEGVEHLGVIVDVGKPENVTAGEKFLDDLAARVRAYPRELVRAVRIGNADEKAFLEKNAPLYIDLQDLKTIRQRIEARRDYEVNKEIGTLLDDDAPPPALDFSDLEKKYEGKVGPDRFPNGRFSSANLHLTLLLIEAGWSEGGGVNAALFDRVKADVRDLGGTDHYAPGMRVGYTGDIAIAVEESSGIEKDLALSSAIVFVLVVGVIVVYYQWWRSILLLMPPLLIATVYAFCAASLPPTRVTELNTNSAFLGSIIVGNGINFGIVLLARYVEERRGGRAVEDALGYAVWGALWGTLAAALGAGVAYASLGITEFRGFRQFGYIGGFGMVFSWLCTFVLLPPLAIWIDRGAHVTRQAPKRRGPMTLVAGAIARYPRAISIAMFGLTLLAGLKVRTFGDAQLEYDLSKLRRADTWVRGEGYWGHRMDELLDTYLTPLVVLTDDRAQATAIGEALRQASREAPLSELVATVRTVDDVVPAEQEQKITEAEAIRKDLTPRLLAAVPPDKRKVLDRVLGQNELRPITIADVPETFTIGMRERNGSIGRTVLVYPRPSSKLWVGPSISTFVDALRDVAATAVPGRPAGRIAGSLALTADIFHSLRHDGPLATSAAFLGVAAVVVVLFRRSLTSACVLVSLCVGVLWLVALAMTLHVRINFTNFIAYPITFGIGVDYAVNVVSRYSLEGWREVTRVVRTTGSAVALCSATTMIGYSSLLIAETQALYLFGLLAVLGEIACLTAGVVALPAFLRWVESRRAVGPSSYAVETESGDIRRGPGAA